MSVYTDERAAKIAGNTFSPQEESLDHFILKLDALGVDTGKIKARELTVVHGASEQTVNVLQGFTEVPSSDSRLGYVLDTFGPRGHNLLSAGGIALLRAAGIAQDRHEAFDLPADDMIELVDQYAMVQAQLYEAFRALESVADIVEARKLEGGGEVKPFDLSDPADFQLAKTFDSYIRDWIATGVGDPSKVGARVRTEQKDQVVITVSDPRTIEKLSSLGIKHSPNDGIFVEKNDDGNVVITLREPQINVEITTTQERGFTPDGEAFDRPAQHKRVQFTEEDLFKKLQSGNLLQDREGVELVTSQYSRVVVDLSSPNDTLRLASEFSDALREAHDQKYPERAGKTTGLSMSFSVSEDIYKIGVMRGQTPDGGTFIFQQPDANGIVPGSTNTSGPMER